MRTEAVSRGADELRRGLVNTGSTRWGQATDHENVAEHAVVRGVVLVGDVVADDSLR